MKSIAGARASRPLGSACQKRDGGRWRMVTGILMGIGPVKKCPATFRRPLPRREGLFVVGPASFSARFKRLCVRIMRGVEPCRGRGRPVRDANGECLLPPERCVSIVSRHCPRAGRPRSQSCAPHPPRPWDTYPTPGRREEAPADSQGLENQFSRERECGRTHGCRMGVRQVKQVRQRIVQIPNG